MDALAPQHEILTKYESCPVCLEKEREFVPRLKEFHNRYLVALANYLQSPLTPLLEQMLTHKCKKCGTIYCDPWLKPELSAALYGPLYGQHRFGWWNFYQWAHDQNEYSTGNQRKDVIWRYMKRSAGSIKTYAELNCAFSGFFTTFARQREQEDNGYRAMIAPHVVSMRQAYNEYENFQGYPVQLPAPPKVEEIPENLYLVTEPSSLCWGENCVHQNTSCHTIATSMFGIRKADFGDIDRAGLHFDVFGAFMVLDHFFRPMEVVEKMADRARIVVLLLHGFNTILHKQHLYQFGNKFEDYLRELGYSVFIIPENEHAMDQKDEQNCRILLVSKEIDLSA